jgi:hypothetical protein
LRSREEELRRTMREWLRRMEIAQGGKGIREVSASRGQADVTPEKGNRRPELVARTDGETV